MNDLCVSCRFSKSSCYQALNIYLRDQFKRNFKWPSMQRWFNARYPLKLCLIKYELDFHLYIYLNCSFSFSWFFCNWQIHRNKHFSSIFHILFYDEGFKGIVVNRTLLLLHGGSLKNYGNSPFKFILWLVELIDLIINSTGKFINQKSGNMSYGFWT